jgi:hypothetical protein
MEFLPQLSQMIMQAGLLTLALVKVAMGFLQQFFDLHTWA